jgi:prevent-host-death family protein
MASKVGVRELKSGASAVLRRARRGETITVTDRGRPVAMLVPIFGTAGDLDERVRALAAAGRVSWAGGKPRGLDRPPRVVGPSVGDAVVEDRR